jgi:hypothetical protein
VSKWTQSGPYSYKYSSTYTPTHTHKQPHTHKHTNTTRTHNRTHTNETIQHTYTHTHIHTHTPTCVCARPQMARRARGPIWTAIYSDPDLEVHRIVDPRVCCPMCATDDEGRVKPGYAFKNHAPRPSGCPCAKRGSSASADRSARCAWAGLGPSDGSRLPRCLLPPLLPD